MVTLSKIYTRGGDAGETSLGSGERRAKHDLRVAAYGTVDEANSVIGLARLYTGPDGADADAEADAMLSRSQNDLFDLGADLCTPEDGNLHHARTVARRAERLMTDLAARETVNPEAVKYVNRLSDHLFVLARRLNDGGKADVLWVPGGNR